jgi:hypothetical protein
LAVILDPPRPSAQRGRRAATPAASRNGKGDVVTAVETIKKLVDEVGVVQVVQITEVFR